MVRNYITGQNAYLTVLYLELFMSTILITSEKKINVYVFCCILLFFKHCSEMQTFKSN